VVKSQNFQFGYISSSKESTKFLSVPNKVIIHKSRGEASLVEQDTIENVSLAYLIFMIIFLRKKHIFFYLHFMQFFSADATISKKKISFLAKKT
jgi:hypothetical protein